MSKQAEALASAHFKRFSAAAISRSVIYFLFLLLTPDVILF